jgi:hypothetical protein
LWGRRNCCVNQNNSRLPGGYLSKCTINRMGN